MKRLPSLPPEPFYRGVKIRRAADREDAVLVTLGTTTVRTSRSALGKWEVHLVRRWESRAQTQQGGIDMAIAVLRELARNPADALETKANDMKVEPPVTTPAKKEVPA